VKVAGYFLQRMKQNGETAIAEGTIGFAEQLLKWSQNQDSSECRWLVSGLAHQKNVVLVESPTLNIQSPHPNFLCTEAGKPFNVEREGIDVTGL
jgi:hypothetical protein